MTTNETLIPTGTCHHRKRRLGRGLAASIAAATLILAGCGGGSNDAATSPSTAASDPDTSSSSTGDSATETTAADVPESGDNCDIVSDEVVAEVLGVEVERREPSSQPEAQTVGCTKGPELGDVPTFVSVYVVSGGAPGFEEFTAGGAEGSEGLEPVDGLGDRAISMPGAVVVAVGTDIVSVQVFKAGQPGSREDLITVANDVIGRLG